MTTFATTRPAPKHGSCPCLVMTRVCVKGKPDTYHCTACDTQLNEEDAMEPRADVLRATRDTYKPFNYPTDTEAAHTGRRLLDDLDMLGVRPGDMYVIRRATEEEHRYGTGAHKVRPVPTDVLLPRT